LREGGEARRWWKTRRHLEIENACMQLQLIREGNPVQTVPPMATKASFQKTVQQLEHHLLWVWREY
jgi:hypothetical protein